MNGYCETCPDQGSTECALPDKTQRIKNAIVTGLERTFDALVVMGAACEGRSIQVDRRSDKIPSRMHRELKDPEVIACITQHLEL